MQLFVLLLDSLPVLDIPRLARAAHEGGLLDEETGVIELLPVEVDDRYGLSSLVRALVANTPVSVRRVRSVITLGVEADHGLANSIQMPLMPLGTECRRAFPLLFDEVPRLRLVIRECFTSGSLTDEHVLRALHQ